MPSPITHIVLAEKVFDKHFSQKNKAEFFIGTSFPDIRYFDNLDRVKTHLPVSSLAEIIEDDSFMAGLKFHSFVDEVHNIFFAFKDNPFFLEPIHITATSLKFFEDELFYNRFSSWPEVANYFKQTVEDENNFNVEKNDIITWHEALEVYFLEKPSLESREKFLKKIEFSDELAKQIEAFMINMRETPQVEKAVVDFYNLFEELIQKPADFKH